MRRFIKTGSGQRQGKSHRLRVERARVLGISGQNFDTALRINGSVRKSLDGGATWPATAATTWPVTNFTDYLSVQRDFPLAWRTQFGYSCLSEMSDGRLGLLYETGSPDCHTDSRGGGCSSACQVRFVTLPAF